jgi:hypothetical protein
MSPFAEPLGVGAGSTIPACNPVPPASQGSCDLTYNDGPVMLTNTTHIVFWAPSGYSYPSGYQALIERYLTDVAADSGDPTNTNSVSTQYYDLAGGTTNDIQYGSTYGGESTDTDSYPTATSTCASLEGSATACLTGTQELDELDSFINSIGGSRGFGDLWFLVLPPNVQTCFDNYSACGPYGAGQPNSAGQTSEYCGYHTSFSGGFSGTTNTIWANITYVDGAGTGCSGQQPNNNAADDAINDMDHEMNESITDPLPYSTSDPGTYNGNNGGWWDANTNNGGEIGDQCNFVNGPKIGSTASGTYDELINGHPYSVQTLWSNATNSCAMNYGAVAPTASFTYTQPSPNALDPVSFDGSGSHDNNSGGSIVSYSWNFGDATSSSSESPSHTYTDSGMYTVTLTVEDSAGLTANTSQTVTVDARPTTLTYTGATSGYYNHSVTLSATLTDNETSNGVGGESIGFSLGTQSCSGVTDGSGDASCSITLAQTPGSGYTAGASFAGDSTYGGNTGSSPFTINQEPTNLTYTGSLSSDYHDQFTASATLTDATGGAPIAGESITFTLGTGNTCSANTDPSGIASCSITPTQTGTQNMVASFAGDVDYVKSSDTNSFVITAEETTIAYTGPMVALSGSGGVTLTATLLEDGTVAVNPAQSVTLSIGSQNCTATTNPSGVVSCTIPTVTGPLGPETVGASFAGDAYYKSASTTGTAVVFAFPSKGAFTLGDKTVASAGSSTVTWWGSDWSSVNSLSGGAAPSAFKGFDSSVTTLPTTTPVTLCGTKFASTGGDSPPPASGVPSYMGVLVASSVKKSGSTINGQFAQIVVVKTNPGYGPTPADNGTGTIVAKYC